MLPPLDQDDSASNSTARRGFATRAVHAGERPPRWSLGDGFGVVEVGPGLVVLLRLSGELPYGRAVEAIDAVKSAGVTKLSLRMER